MSKNWLKQSQRRQLLHTRHHLPAWFQQTCSIQVCEHIMRLPAYQQATHISLYRAVNNEINLDSLWLHALGQGKTCYFPIVHQTRHLTFAPATTSDTFKNNRYGIPEPIIKGPTEETRPVIDIYFLPLVGFDVHGYRLGMGAGCYDRTLATLKDPYCIGVGYAFQELKYIFAELTDIQLNLIITEHGVIYPQPRNSL